MMMKNVALVLILLSSTVVAQLHNFPYVSSVGHNFNNHSYVQFSQQENNYLLCYTDLVTCCNSTEGPVYGGWYFPNGSRLNEYGYHSHVVQRRRLQRIDLYFRIGSHVAISGIYTCRIQTMAVQNTEDLEIIRVTIKFCEGEEICHLVCTCMCIIDNYIMHTGDVKKMTFELKSDQFDENPQFTLSYNIISNGGSATTATWYRDGVNISEGVRMASVLQNLEINHTLSVSGKRGGFYQSSVSDNKSCLAIFGLDVEGE